MINEIKTIDEFKTAIGDYTQDWKYVGDKNIILDFYTSTCTNCKKIEPILNDDNINVCKINCNDLLEIAEAFDVTGLPMLYALSPSCPEDEPVWVRWNDDNLKSNLIEMMAR